MLFWSVVLAAISCAPVSGVPVARRRLPPLPASTPAGEGLGAARTIQPAGLGAVDPAALAYAAQHSTRPSSGTGGVSSPELHVTVPAGVQPGSNLLVETPDGQHLQVTVPPATVPGQTILVHVPPLPQTVLPPASSLATVAQEAALSTAGDERSVAPTLPLSPATAASEAASLTPDPSTPLPAIAATEGAARQTVTILNRDLSHLM
eukprot:COSAG02_NODE_8335_length_2609_cov_5.570120_3_plen_206_part_00